MRIYFVEVGELLDATADGVLTVGELKELRSLRKGYATHTSSSSSIPAARIHSGRRARDTLRRPRAGCLKTADLFSCIGTRRAGTRPT